MINKKLDVALEELSKRQDYVVFQAKNFTSKCNETSR